MWLFSVSLSVRCLRMIKADSICDELSSPLFLTFCPRKGHTLPMGSFLSTISSLCIHFAGRLILARSRI